MGLGDEIGKLADLHERGVIDEDEFRRAKQQLLAGAASSASDATDPPPEASENHLAWPDAAAQGAGADAPPPPPPPRPTGPSFSTWPASTRPDTTGLALLAGWTRWLVWGAAGLFGLSALTGVNAWLVFEEYADGLASAATSTQADDTYWAMLGFAFIVFVVAAVLVIIWTFQEHKRLSAVHGTNFRYSRGWTIGGWVIPIGNLWIPKRIVDDLWRHAANRMGQTELSSHVVPARHHWWWGLWLVGAILNQVAGAIEPRDQGTWEAFYSTTILGDASWAVAGILLGLTIKDVTSKTSAKLAGAS